MNFDRRNKVGTALAVIAVVLFVAPALFPVQPVLVHDSRVWMSPGVLDDGEDRPEIVAYGNLSERGQELYAETLESNSGEYRVPDGEGAPDFEYPDPQELEEARENDNRLAGHVIIERPEGETDLPPAPGGVSVPPEMREEMSDEELERLDRLDMLQTRQGQPPLGSTPQLLRLGAVMLAVICLGLGGYLLSSK